MAARQLLPVVKFRGQRPGLFLKFKLEALPRMVKCCCLAMYTFKTTEAATSVVCGVQALYNMKIRTYSTYSLDTIQFLSFSFFAPSN